MNSHGPRGDGRVVPAIRGGCHPARDCGAAVEAPGWRSSADWAFGASALEPGIRQIVGVARSS
jgi:hypothetical protein